MNKNTTPDHLEGWPFTQTTVSQRGSSPADGNSCCRMRVSSAQRRLRRSLPMRWFIHPKSETLSGVQMLMVDVSDLHSRKSNMEPEDEPLEPKNWWFENDVPFQVDIFRFHVIFLECTHTLYAGYRPTNGMMNESHFRNKQFEGRTHNLEHRSLESLQISEHETTCSLVSWSSFGEQKPVTICFETRCQDILLLVISGHWGE